MSLRRFFFPALAGLAALVSAPSAHAEFSLTIEVTGQTFVIENDSSLDRATGDPTLIDTLLEDVNNDLADFGFKLTALSLFSNRTLLENPAALTLTATVQRINANGDGQITITGRDDGYTLPDGGRTFESSGGPNFRSAPGSTAQLTNRYEDGTDAQLQSPVFTSTGGAQNFAFNGGPIDLGVQTGPFSLVTVFDVTLATVGAEVGTVNTALVTSNGIIPEPASVAMLVIGGSVLSARSLRRRKADA